MWNLYVDTHSHERVDEIKLCTQGVCIDSQCNAGNYVVMLLTTHTHTHTHHTHTHTRTHTTHTHTPHTSTHHTHLHITHTHTPHTSTHHTHVRTPHTHTHTHTHTSTHHTHVRTPHTHTTHIYTSHTRTHTTHTHTHTHHTHLHITHMYAHHTHTHTHTRTHPDLCDHLVETPESPAHLSCLLTLLPTADDLVTQLKPKLIHDPLLDDKGQPFTHQRLFRCVYECECACVHGVHVCM